MPGCHGLRRGTRHSFAKAYGTNGYIPLTVYLRNYKLGDYVDIKANGTIHKGMPFKYYHGRTGRVWNVTKRAVGVELLKLVGGRYEKKRIHVRIEHVQPSRSREGFLERRAANEKAKADGKKAGVSVNTKRIPAQPRAAFTLTNVKMDTITPIPYDIVKEGLQT